MGAATPATAFRAFGACASGLCLLEGFVRAVVAFEGAVALAHVAMAQPHGIHWIWARRHSRVRMARLLQVLTAASLPVLEACVLGCVAVDGAASHGCGAAVAGVRLVTICVLLLTWLCCCVACTQHWVCRCAAGRQVGGSRQHMCPRRETELCCCFDALVSLLNGSLLRHTLQCCLMHVAAGAVHMEEQGHARQGALFGSHAGGSQRTTSAGCWGAGWMVCVSVCCYVSCVRVQLTLGPGTLGT